MFLLSLLACLFATLPLQARHACFHLLSELTRSTLRVFPPRRRFYLYPLHQLRACFRQSPTLCPDLSRCAVSWPCRVPHASTELQHQLQGHCLGVSAVVDCDHGAWLQAVWASTADRAPRFRALRESFSRGNASWWLCRRSPEFVARTMTAPLEPAQCWGSFVKRQLYENPSTELEPVGQASGGIATNSGERRRPGGCVKNPRGSAYSPAGAHFKHLMGLGMSKPRPTPEAPRVKPGRPRTRKAPDTQPAGHVRPWTQIPLDMETLGHAVPRVVMPGEAVPRPGVPAGVVPGPGVPGPVGLDAWGVARATCAPCAPAREARLDSSIGHNG